MDAERRDGEARAMAMGLLAQAKRPVNTVRPGLGRQRGVCSDQDRSAGSAAFGDKIRSLCNSIGLTKMADDHADPVGKLADQAERICDPARICQKKAAGQRRRVARGGVRRVCELAEGAGPVLHRDMPNTALTDEIAASRNEILGALADAASQPVELIAVSKKQPDDRIEAALAAGHRVFGENRVQEAQERWQDRRDIDGLQLHLIGPLQSNKSEDAVALFDVIQTVDRKKIVRTLSEAAEKLERFPDLLIQVNTGEEDQKSGVSPAEVADLIAYTRETYKGELKGLMCIPPVDEPAGPHFALLAKLAAQAELPWVSMGMSADYALAARFGATHVRVGSAFFGERPDPA